MARGSLKIVDGTAQLPIRQSVADVELETGGIFRGRLDGDNGIESITRFNEFSRLWSEAGHEVSVIAAALNYSTGTGPEAYRGRWVTREQDGAVTVYRCYVPETYSKSYVGRMWSFTGFTASSCSALTDRRCTGTATRSRTCRRRRDGQRPLPQTVSSRMYSPPL